MKTLALCVAVLGLGLTGCIVISRDESPVCEPLAVFQPGSPEAVACAEIDAAGKLTFDSSQTSDLSAIAARPNLSPEVQVHLASTVLRQLRFESSKMTVFQMLIQNPSFSNAAKQYLLANLSRMRFDSDKTALLQLINGRGNLKA